MRFASLILPAVCFLGLAGFARPARADLIIDLFNSGGNATIRVSGSGTLTPSANAGLQLDFLNIGDAFDGLTGTNDFNLSTDIEFTGTDNSSGSGYTSTFNVLRLSNSPTSGGDDLILRPGSHSYSGLDTYSVNSTSTVVGLNLADLTPGSYIASNSVGDAMDFGQVTINISAVPEPSGGLLGLALVGLLAVRRRRS